MGKIKCTNLCIKIIPYSSPNKTAICNLGSLSLPAFVLDENTFDFEQLRKQTKILTKNLKKGHWC